MSELFKAIQQNRDSILKEWLDSIRAASRRRDLIDDRELEVQTSEVVATIVDAPAGTALEDFNAPGCITSRISLSSLSASRAALGFTPSETALFVLSLKPSLFTVVRGLAGNNAEQLFVGVTTVNDFIDRLALHTTDSFIAARNQVIARQQEEMLELSTPVVTLWEGIVALPLIGTLDSARTQVVMESLLQAIVQTNSRFAIIDITGVPTVDTLVAQHLLKTITAARLMGAECILSGIRPQIAQTIVHLGINLSDITTKARLADAFKVALERTGRSVTRAGKPGGSVATATREL